MRTERINNISSCPNRYIEHRNIKTVLKQNCFQALPDPSAHVNKDQIMLVHGILRAQNRFIIFSHPIIIAKEKEYRKKSRIRKKIYSNAPLLFFAYCIDLIHKSISPFQTSISLLRYLKPLQQVVPEYTDTCILYTFHSLVLLC